MKLPCNNKSMINISISDPKQKIYFHSPNLQACKRKGMSVLADAHCDRSVTKTLINTKSTALVKGQKE